MLSLLNMKGASMLFVRFMVVVVLVVGVLFTGLTQAICIEDRETPVDTQKSDDKIRATGVEPLLKNIKELPGAENEPAIIGEGRLYTLGTGDILEIIVRNQPEFSGRFIVGPDGKVQYNFVGDIQATGITKDQIKSNLEKVLDQYVKVPEVSVTILEYRSKNVYVLGDVEKPGIYPMKGDNITLREAIVAAGLPTRTAALRRSYIVTPDSRKATLKKVDLFALLYKGKENLDYNLLPGQIVVVPSTVPSEINRALTTLLSPLFQAEAADAAYQRHK